VGTASDHLWHLAQRIDAQTEPAPVPNPTPRPSRIKLPSFYPFAVAVVAIGEAPIDSDPWARHAAGELAELTGALLTQAPPVADAVTPLSAGHALVMFRPALDALAAHLTRWHGGRTEPFVGVVQPPANFPMALQTAIMRLAEAVQAAQDWDAGLAPGRAIAPL